MSRPSPRREPHPRLCGVAFRTKTGDGRRFARVGRAVGYPRSDPGARLESRVRSSTSAQGGAA
jgi:hypothetical protein